MKLIQFQKLSGMVAAAATVIPLLRAHPLQQWVNRFKLHPKFDRHVRVRVTRRCIQMLHPWKNKRLPSHRVPLGNIPARQSVITSDGMESSLGRQVCQRCLGASLDLRAHQCAGAQGNLPLFEGFPPVIAKQTCFDKDRQYVFRGQFRMAKIYLFATAETTHCNQNSFWTCGSSQAKVPDMEDRLPPGDMFQSRGLVNCTHQSAKTVRWKVKNAGVYLWPNQSFLPKVLRLGTINQVIKLDAFHPHPPWSSTSFSLFCQSTTYIHWAYQSIATVTQLFVRFDKKYACKPLSKQRFSYWIVDTIFKVSDIKCIYLFLVKSNKNTSNQATNSL